MSVLAIPSGGGYGKQTMTQFVYKHIYLNIVNDSINSTEIQNTQLIAFSYNSVMRFAEIQFRLN